MEVTWLGGSCFRLQTGAVSVLTDPFDLPPSTPPLSADIVTLSTREARSRLTVSGPHRLVDGPGEYEIKGVPVTGVATRRPPADGQDAGRNFVYTIQMEGVTACHLGRIGRAPTSQEVQEFGAPDVLFVPLGEPGGLTVQQAIALASQLESKILVPIVAGGVDGQAVLERFCRELGSDPAARETKLSVTSSGLPPTARAAVLSLPEATAGG